MRISGRDRMIASINSLTGRSDCTEAVLAQGRPPWAAAAFIPGALIMALISSALDLPPVVAGAVVGGAAAMGFVAVTSYYVIGRTAQDVVIAQSWKLSARAVEILTVLPLPGRVAMSPALVSTKVTLNGQRFYLGRQFAERLRRIVGDTGTPAP